VGHHPAVRAGYRQEQAGQQSQLIGRRFQRGRA
jgi:hypothetical protein